MKEKYLKNKKEKKKRKEKKEKKTWAEFLNCYLLFFFF